MVPLADDLRAAAERINALAPAEAAHAFAAEIAPMMAELRRRVDGVEECMPAAAWPYPSYTDMLYY